MTSKPIATADSNVTNGNNSVSTNPGSRSLTRPPFPFTAIVGQDEIKKALLLNAVSPSVGGVLIQGEKGNAKSTAVRALAKLLPPVAVVPGCPLACDPQEPFSFCPHCKGEPWTGELHEKPAPFVEIPLGTSEDRLLGHMNLDAALSRGDRFFEAGLLARAHRGVLYVDEINLLSDHLVDILLDAAASGWNHVERDGFSVSHPAKFILVGTMNPEEGELRPQLLDRFGLSVEVGTPQEISTRTEIMKRRLAYEQSAAQFSAEWAQEEEQLRSHLAKARSAFAQVELPAARLEQVAGICLQAQTEGMRADLVICEAAKALAAFHGHPAVTAQNVLEAAPLALYHRSAHPWQPDPGPDGSDSGSASGDSAGADRGDGGGSPADGPSANSERTTEPAGERTQADSGAPGAAGGAASASGAEQRLNAAGDAAAGQAAEPPGAAGQQAAAQRSQQRPGFAQQPRYSAAPSENPNPGADSGSPRGGGGAPRRAGSAGGGLSAAERAARRERRRAAGAGASDAAGGAPQFHAQQLLPADSLFRVDLSALRSKDGRAPGNRTTSAAAFAGAGGNRSDARSRGAKGGQEHGKAGRHIRSRQLMNGRAIHASGEGPRIDWSQTIAHALIRTSHQNSADVSHSAYSTSAIGLDSPSTRLSIRKDDLYEKVFLLKPKKLHVFLLDASGSMSSFQRMKQTKAAVLAMMERYYQQRELFALLCFRNQRAELALAPTLSLQHARRVINDLPSGGDTPLALGIKKGQQWLKRWLNKEKELKPHLLLLTDGKLNSAPSLQKLSPLEEALAQAKQLAAENYPVTVIDTETGRIRLGLARQLAAALRANHYYTLDELALSGF